MPIPPIHVKGNLSIDGANLNSVPETKHGHSVARKPPEEYETDRFPAAFKMRLNSIICNGPVMLQSMCLCKIGDLCTWNQYSRMYIHVVYSSNQSDHLKTSMATVPPRSLQKIMTPTGFQLPSQ